MPSFSGIFPALVTPMDEDFSIDLQTLRKVVAFQVDHGVDGLWIAGATGEGVSLSADERCQIAETAIDAAGGHLKVIVHVGSLESRQTFALAEHAEKCGADAIASVPPFFYGVTAQEIVDHYRRLADRCSLPLFVYHLPGCTHVSVTPEIVGQLLDHGAIQGIKFSDHNLTTMRQIKSLAPDRLSVLFGMDAMFLGGLVMGADGSVGGTSNYMPQVQQLTYRAHRDGDLVAATELQVRATRFITELACGMSPVVFIKQAMSFLGLDCGPTRPPLRSPSTEQRQAMQRCWDEHTDWLAMLCGDQGPKSTSATV